jgi:hypothetical protein
LGKRPLDRSALTSTNLSYTQGRHNCNFTTNPGPNSCADGGCNGGLECDPHSGTGVPPASVAEWTLSAADGLDWYDGEQILATLKPYRFCSYIIGYSELGGWLQSAHAHLEQRWMRSCRMRGRPRS